MESKKINQLATNVAPQTSDLTIIGDPITGVSKKITLLQIANLFATTGTVSSVAVTETGDALTITGSPITSAGTINIGFAGDATQYVRGDGALADFPTSTGGGSSVSYYLNSSVSQGTIGGVAYRELSKDPISGAGTDITISANGYVASYITDANDPALLEVPGGNFNCEFYFSVNSNNHDPYVYAELYKYDGSTFTLLGSSQSVPEYLSNGTTLSPYYFAIPVATAVLSVTDRLAIRIYVNVDGRVVTLHTENNHLCQVVTTFSKGLTSLNNLTRQNQFFGTGTSGTDFNISSTTATHTFNIPSASATNRGLITTGSQTIAGAKTFTTAITNNEGYILKDLGAATYVGVTAGFGGFSYNNTVAGFARYNFSESNGSVAILNFPTSVSSKIYTFPDANGTIALTSNLSSYVPYTGATAPVDLGGNSLYFNNGQAIFGRNFTGTTAYALIGVNPSNKVSIDTSALGVVFGGTIGNGTYTYTLPSATGTLALTSDLTGGTVTSVAALTIGTTGTDLSSSVATSTTTPVITLNVPTASATNRGALSSADWTTFNNKQSALTNPVTGTGTTNYLPKFTGASTIGNSNLINDASGNLGLGVTPSAWFSTWRAIEIGGADSNVAGNGTGPFRLLRNAYIDAAGTWIYKNTGEASFYQQSTGNHIWFNAPSGTAGNAITFTQAMTLDASGNLGVGTTSPTSYITRFIEVSNATSSGIKFSGATSGLNAGVSLGFITSDNSFRITNYESTGVLRFETQDLTRATVTAAGNFLIGTTTDAGYKLDVNGTGRFSGNLSAVFNSTTNNPYIRFDQSGSAKFFIGERSTVSGDGGTGYDLYTVAGNDLRFFAGATKALTLATTGAATFSSSVTIGAATALNFGARGGITQDGSWNFSWSTNSVANALYLQSSTGNVGIGTTGSDWNTIKPVQIGQAGNFFAGFQGGSAIYMGTASYYNSGWKYASTGDAGNLLDMGSGNFIFSNAVSGTTGNTITWNERMRITSGGEVLIGTTTSTGVGASRLQLTGAADAQLIVSNTTGSGHIALYSTGVDAYITKNTASGIMYFGLAPQNGQSFTSQMSINNAGVITIPNLAGTGSRAVLADASGVLSAPVSDISVKQNITSIGYGLSEILKMNPVWFDFIDEYKNYGEGRQNGNIAQEMEEIIPEAVFTTPSTGKMGINYDQLHAVYIKAIQELKAEIEELKLKIK